MKTFLPIIVCFCLISAPLMIQGSDSDDDVTPIKYRLKEMAERGDNIDNIFEPSIDGWLGSGSVGVTYKGTLLRNNIEVAMKFIPDDEEDEAERELQAYTALGAVNNTNSEAFGIPTLYHYGRWKKFIMIGITLLDSEFANIKDNHLLSTVDMLILFREFVRISKFIHSRRICHGDSHLDNIMFRKHRSFLIDYNMAINSRNNPNLSISCAKQDWRKFLADIAYTCFRVDIDWSSLESPVNKLRNIQPGELRKVFIEFAKTTYEDEKIKYSKVYKTINEQIVRYNGQETALVSWLTADQELEAYNDLSWNPLPSIESIR